MLVTEDLFQAFLKCETKSYLKFIGLVGEQHEIGEWQQQVVQAFRQKCCVKLRSNFAEDACLSNVTHHQLLENNKYQLLTGCVIRTSEIQSLTDALERAVSPVKAKYYSFVPIRFVPSEKVSRDDKLLLAFDALALSLSSGKMPSFGKIMHGSEQKIVKVNLAGLMKATRSAVRKIVTQQATRILS